MNTNNVQYDQADECIIHSRVSLIFIMFVMMMVFDCVYSPTYKDKITKLQKEHNSLKNLIVKSIENAIINHMKNGNDPEDTFEEE